ncbi:hypothetical protein [Chroococcidiopsis thermalis]|uniref:Uncharacterized protein n=1 Tax=Chroococcidiopsis thermalis (strain PCC 7203) TaxID=251229 RepID=K9U9K0_CHRTP|nr:hypothetical protein [Chroococcidiopsis thermalis]AFY91263.1 hypothetical protein Chro_5929 [Chroococcidiopsis thermalis PCC 7203]
MKFTRGTMIKVVVPSNWVDLSKDEQHILEKYDGRVGEVIKHEQDKIGNIKLGILFDLDLIWLKPEWVEIINS